MTPVRNPFLAACLAGAALAACPGAARADLANLTVDEAVRLALQNNSQVYVAQKQVEQAEGLFKSSRSSLLPQVSATGQLAREHSGEQKSAITGGGKVLSSDTDARFGNLSISQNLVDLSLWNGVKESARQLDAARSGRSDFHQSVVLAVKQQFFSLVRAKELEGVAREAATLDSVTLVQTRGLFDVGSLAKTDLLKARTQFATAQLALLQSRHTTNLERLRLASVLGLDNDLGLDVQDRLGEDVAVPDSASLLRMAMASRQDLAQSEHRVEAGEAGLAAARALRYPNLGASANYQVSKNHTSQDTTGQYVTAKILDGFQLRLSDTTLVPIYRDTLFQQQRVFDSSPAGWSVGARISLPLFDGFRASGQIQAREAELSIRRRTLAQKRVDIALEVRQAWQSLVESRERIIAARGALESAEESYSLNREKYRLGSSTFVELQAAEVQLTRSRSDLVEARVGLQLAKAQLDRVLGQTP